MHRFVYKFLLTKFFKFIDNLFFCNGQTFVCDFKGPLIDKFPYGQTHFCLPMELKLKYLENREKHLDRYREYYKENKEILCEKRNSKYNCECGSEIKLTEKARHFKSKKHQTFISNQLSV